MTLCQQIVTSLSFFRFRAYLEQSRSWIPDKLSVKLTFSLKVTFYLTKTENITKIAQHSFLTNALSEGTIFAKNAEISKIKRALALKDIFLGYMCVWTKYRTKFQVSSINLTSFRQEVNFTLPLPPQSEPLKTHPD